MRTILASIAPQQLVDWVAANPHGTWKQFRSSRSRRRAVQETVLRASAGRCAYCEQLLDQTHVEHVHPKSKPTCRQPARTSTNWDLDPDNIIAECGTPGRCGNAKGGRDLCGLIRDPRDPATESALTYELSGAIVANQVLGRLTIEELRLDGDVLEELRADQIGTALESYEEFRRQLGDAARARAETWNLMFDLSFPSAVSTALKTL